MNISTKKERLYAELKVGILEGKFRKKFPPEPEFARNLNVSRNTLRGVYALLEADGLVMRHPGNGTMITPEPDRLKKNVLFCYMSHPKHFTVDFIVPSILQGVEKALPSEWGIESCPVSHLKELPEGKAIQIFKARNICALIVADSFFNGDEAILSLAKKGNLPTVIAYCRPEDHETTHLPVVANCFRQAWEEGLDFLKSQGHTRVITLNSDAEKIRNIYPLDVYLELLKGKGLSPDPELVLNLPLDEEIIFDALKKLEGKYTAVYCYSDFYAQKLYRALNKLKLRVPEDISVLGYCGFCGGAYFNPPLTTVELDYSGIGIQAVEILRNSSAWFNKKGVNPPCQYTTYNIKQRESFRNLNIKGGQS